VSALSSVERHCTELARQSGSNFFLAFRLLPTRLYVDLCVIYAWLRTLDDLSDGGDFEQRERNLNEYWTRTQNAFDGVDVRQSRWAEVLTALPIVAKRHEIALLDLKPSVDGAMRDLKPQPFQSFAELDAYCDQVAGSVGQIILKVGQVKDESLMAKGQALGRAFQYTNIARDVNEDQRLGRCYIPQELLQGRSIDEAALTEFLKPAQNYFEQSDGLEDQVPSPHIKLMVALMRHVYADLFRKIKSNPSRVLQGRVRVGRTKKAYLFARVYLRGLFS
jgi:phytoene synthase